MFNKSVFVISLFLACACMFFPAPVSGQDAGDGWKEYKLEYSDNFKELEKITTPDPLTPQLNNDINNFIPLFDSRNGTGRLCTVSSAEPDKVFVDVDDDTNLETEVKKSEVLLNFKVKFPDKKDRPYQAVIWQDATKWLNNVEVPNWRFKRACFYKGNVNGEQVILIDDNCNGKFNDLEKDTLLVGKTSFACFLSKAILLKDKLYQIKVDDTGEKIWLKDLDPSIKTGQIDLLSKYKHNKMKPQAVIISSDEYSFNAVSSSKKPAAVPVGEYKLVLALFTDRVWARGGKFQPIKVEEGKTTTVEWGGPFKLEIDPQMKIGGDVYVFTPPSQYVSPRRDPVDVDKYKTIPFVKMEELPKFYGDKGEEYFGAPRYKDAWGYCLADDGVKLFTIEILPMAGGKDGGGTKVAVKSGSKPLNRTGNSEHELWKTIDMSGLVQKQPDWWEYYQCPIENFHGQVQVKVGVDSRLFGKLEDVKTVIIP